MTKPIPDLDFGPYEVDPESVRLLPQMFCLTHDVLILGKVDPNANAPVVVGLSDLNNMDTLDSVSRVLRGRRVLPVRVSSDKIQRALAAAYGLDKVNAPVAERYDPPQELDREVILARTTKPNGRRPRAGCTRPASTPKTTRRSSTWSMSCWSRRLRRGATDIHIENFRYNR